MAITSDFRFWEDRAPIHRQSFGYSSGDYVEFRVQNHHDQDQFSAINSPPLWTKVPKNISTLEAKSPFLPHDHHYSSCLSPTSRLRAILDGKRELMEMIKDLPESSSELSLKDIIEDHGEVKEVVLVEEKKTDIHYKIGKRIIQRNDNKKKNKSSKIHRAESMESGVFLLKMFLPAALTISKKRSDSRKWSINNGPEPAPEGSDKSQISTKWWKIMFIFLRDYKNRINIRRNSSEMDCFKDRLVGGTDMSCQWSLCIHMKRSSSGQRVYLFCFSFIMLTMYIYGST
ncbi:uncharacterized protein LOC142546591 [Primulina tabacum]|uniref:uncharacterized protein LOC142546591 n=1 Tax=Primulina tabacum TaxID=48773 RepID=UPI003F5A5C29